MDGLTRVGKRYIYRRRVPADLVAAYGKTEIKKSLQTGRYTDAIKLARLIAADTDRSFTEARILTKLDQQTIQRIQARYFHERLKDQERLREQVGNPNPTLPNNPQLTLVDDAIIQELQYPDFVEDAALSYELSAQIAKEELATGKHLANTRLNTAAQSIMTDLGITLTPDSPEYQKVIRHLALADIDAHKVNADRYRGDYTGQTELAAADKYPTASGMLFTDMLGNFLDYRGMAIKQTTVNSYRAVCTVFVELIGNRPVDDYTTHDLVQYRDLIAKLPAAWANKYRDIPATELVTRTFPAETKLTSARTLIKYLDRITAVFNYAYDEGHIPRQIGRRSKPVIRRAQVKASKWRPYTDEDVQALLLRHITHRKTTPHIGWLPLLSLYTGARRGELAGLMVDDVKQVEGIWCIDIMTEYDSTSSGPKSEHSRRYVPLHPVLIDCGILEYAEQRRTAKKVTLFEVKAENYGKVFARMKDKLPDPERKSFHSFRGTFTNALKQQMVSSDLYHSIIGHAPAHKLDVEYTDDYTVPNKHNAVCKLGTFGMDKDKLISAYKIYLPAPPRRGKRPKNK